MTNNIAAGLLDEDNLLSMQSANTGTVRAPVSMGLTHLMVVSALAGFTVMGFEMTLVRQTAPHLGASMPVWAVIISWTLLAVATGYGIGGHLSQRWASSGLLGLLFAAAGFGLILSALSGPALLSYLMLDRSGLASAALKMAALLAYAGLTGAILALLGASAPIAVRVGVVSLESSGKVAGRLYASSTVGSLLGTLSPAFLTLPLWGTRWTLLFHASLCILIGVYLLGRHKFAVPALGILVIAGLLPGQSKPTLSVSGTVLARLETPYSSAQVLQRPNGLRELRVNAGRSVQSISYPVGPSRHGSWPLFLVAQIVRSKCQSPPDKVLILGLGAGTHATDMLFAYPRAEVHGVEIDAGLVELGRRYFNLPKQTRVHITDARFYLQESGGGYDLIFGDAYKDLYPPFHLMTREFFQLAKEKLNDGGAIAVNTLSLAGEDGLVRAVAQTMDEVFDHVATVSQPELANVVLLGWDTAAPSAATTSSGDNGCALPDNPIQRHLLSGYQRGVEPWKSDPSIQVFTDDKAPVEMLSHKMVWAALSGGSNRRNQHHPPGAKGR